MPPLSTPRQLEARQLSERQPEAALPLLEEALQAARQARQRREEINAQSLMGKARVGRGSERCHGGRVAPEVHGGRVMGKKTL